LDAEHEQITQLLKRIGDGDSLAAEKLLPLVYAELHRLAKAYMRRERSDHTLQATALVNEAYIRLAGQNVDWTGREHFLGIAANTMRRVLVDHARAHNAEHRGGELRRVELHDDIMLSEDRLADILFLHEALNELEREDARQAKVVELRYFGGLSVEEIASLLGIAPRSVKRDWALARLWLFRRLQPGID
jgi:RNA polymerase sigma-70 factor (ECF subfamily)